MASKFPLVMTALLAREEIAAYFPAIRRQRVDVPNYSGPLPMIQVYVTDNADDQGSGDGEAVQIANYTCVVAARMEPATNQDALIASMVDAVRDAARNLVYNTGGYASDVTLGSWASDDNMGSSTGAKVWVAIPLRIEVRNV